MRISLRDRMSSKTFERWLAEEKLMSPIDDDDDDNMSSIIIEAAVRRCSKQNYYKDNVSIEAQQQGRRRLEKIRARALALQRLLGKKQTG